MGKSKTIQEQQKTNQEFHEYIVSMNKDLDQRQAELSDQLDEMEKKHYVNFPDKALMIEGKYSHLTTLSEWSLKSISAIIEDCSRALLGEKKESPEGSTMPETSIQTSESVKALKDRETYIANEALAVVQSIVGKFNYTTATSVEKGVTAKPIAPGMTLFIGVENNAYSSNHFFSNEKIIQTIFVFRVCYSIAEGQKQSALSTLQAYEDQKEMYIKIILDLKKEASALHLSDPNDLKTFRMLKEIIQEMNEALNDTMKSIMKLTEVQLKQEMDDCMQIVEQMQTKRIGIECAQNGYKRTSTAFTYSGSEDQAADLIRARIPQYVYLVSVALTDDVENHFNAVFSANDPISLSQANQWVERALSGSGNFRFD